MGNSPIPPNVRAIYFDAVDTLIAPDPPVIEVYRNAGLRHGCEVSPELLMQRFREAFRREEQADVLNGWSVSEDRERERWSSIVSHAFGGSSAVDAIFAELWTHFAHPDSWRVADATELVMNSLTASGYRLGLASNFDRRLHAIADGLQALSSLKLRIVSSEVGWRKPSPRFFDAVVQAAACDPSQVLFIGDRRDTDYDGAIDAGLQALLLDPTSKALATIRRISSIRELSESNFTAR